MNNCTSTRHVWIRGKRKCRCGERTRCRARLKTGKLCRCLIANDGKPKSDRYCVKHARAERIAAGITVPLVGPLPDSLFVGPPEAVKRLEKRLIEEAMKKFSKKWRPRS